MEMFLLKLLGSVAAGAAIKGLMAVFGHSIAWGWAMLIGFVIVFGGFLIMDSDVIN